MAGLALLLHGGLLLLAAPVLAGLMQRVGARLAGEAPPSVAQPWRTLRRLLRKQALRPAAASLVFTAAPVVSLAATAAAALLVPSFTLGMASAPLADLLVLAGLLGLAHAAILLAAYDAGSPRAALAAQRAPLTAVLAGPALLLLILVAAVQGGGTNIDAAAAVLREAGPLRWSMALAAAALIAVLLAGAGAGPEPEYAGPDLALLQLAAQLRRVLLLSLLATLFLPFGLAAPGRGPDAWLVGACCWALKLGGLGLGYAAVAGLRRRLRPGEAPELAALGLVLALLAAAALLAGQGAA